jgi:hypothetical protein
VQQIKYLCIKHQPHPILRLYRRLRSTSLDASFTNWAFNSKPLKERRELLMKHGNCFRCVNGKHVAKDCKEVIKCGTCNSSQHCTIMHDTSFVKATIRLAAEPQPFMVLFIYLFFFADHRATVFTRIKNFRNCAKKKSCAAFCQFLS